jgi:hypothetical protein
MVDFLNSRDQRAEGAYEYRKFGYGFEENEWGSVPSFHLFSGRCIIDRDVK